MWTMYEYGTIISWTLSMLFLSLTNLGDTLSCIVGCAVIISHDRWFLDRIATHILAFEGDSQVITLVPLLTYLDVFIHFLVHFKTFHVE